MALISMTMVFAVPKVRETIFMDSQRKTFLWLSSKFTHLKKTALLEQRIYALHIDIDTDRVWITHADMPSDEQLASKNNSTPIPDGMRTLNIDLAQKGSLSAGIATIHFYPKGYSDNAFIHLESDDRRFSIQIEPFQDNISIFDDHAGFQNGNI